MGVELSGAVLLQDTSLALRPGSCAAVRGPNGAGKTTLLRVLAGRLRPTSGRATLFERSLFERTLDERARTVRQHIAALIEPPVLYPDLTLRDQIALIVGAWAGTATRPDARLETRADVAAVAWPGFGEDAIDRFEIRHLETRFPHELSSGQRQLVSLAVTFARPGSVLLLDEPEQRLDPHRRGLLGDAILAARSAGVAVAFASHDAELVARVADTSLYVGGAAV